MEYEKSKLEEIFQSLPYTNQAKAVEQERCEADLLYELFMHPDHMLTLKDPSTGAVTEMKLIDRILGVCIELVAKKNSPDYGKMRMITDNLAFLRSPAADSTVKLFNFLFFLQKEPEIRAMMLKGYHVNHPGNLWGQGFELHFDDFMKRLDIMTEGTLNNPINPVEVVLCVRNLVQHTRKTYLLI
jgi:hypothetical protein